MKTWKFLSGCLLCLFLYSGEVAGQTVTRLTSNEHAKMAYTISGNGTSAVWIETLADVYALKIVNTDGTPIERTLITTDSSKFIPGLVGPDLGNVQVFHPSLRVSYDGSKVVLHVIDSVWQKDCFAIVNTATNAVQVIAAAAPAGMGTMDVKLLDPAAFDVNDDGSIIAYTLTANYSGSTEDASALVAVSPGSSPYRLSGYTAKVDVPGGAVTYSDGPNHIGRPSVAGNTVTFAGNPNAQREVPTLSYLYTMDLAGGSASARATGITEPHPVNLASYIFNVSGATIAEQAGNFFPWTSGAAITIPDPDGSRFFFPFVDTGPGIVKVAVGAQTSSVLSVLRSSGEVEQLRSDDASLPSGWHFGASGCAGGTSYETWNAVPRNGGKILFTMCGGSGLQDLFVQNGMKNPQPTRTPTVVPTPAHSCSLKVGKSCKRKIRKGSVCSFTMKLFKTGSKAPVKNARYSFQRKSGSKAFRSYVNGKLGSKGTATRNIVVKKRYAYRTVFPAYGCTTKQVIVTVR